MRNTADTRNSGQICSQSRRIRTRISPISSRLSLPWIRLGLKQNWPYLLQTKILRSHFARQEQLDISIRGEVSFSRARIPRGIQWRNSFFLRAVRHYKTTTPINEPTKDPLLHKSPEKCHTRKRLIPSQRPSMKARK